MMRARYLGLVWLFVLCSAVFGEEDFERMLELYQQSGYANVEQRLREYEALQKMRRASGQRHLPAGSQFNFARESFRQMRAHAPGETGANGCAWTSAGPTNLNGRVISLAIDPMNNQNIYAATVGGLWRSTTAGRRWQRVSDEIMAMRFSAIAVNPGATNEIFAGAGDRNLSVNETGNGLWRSISSGAPGSWKNITTPDFNGTTIYRIRIDPDAPHDVYVAASNGVWIGTHDAGGITFQLLGNLDAITHDLAIDFSATPPTIYATVRKKKGSFGVGVYKYDHNLKLWNHRDTGIVLDDAETISLGLAPFNPSILYAKVSQQSDGTLIGIFKTTTAAEKPAANKDAWTMLPLGEDNKGVPDEIMGWFNTVMEVDPTNPDRVFAAGIRLWLSIDGGKEWKNISFGTDPANELEAHGDVHALAFDPFDPKIIYIGNDGGVDRSTDLSKPQWHWVDVSHGMNITMFYNLTSNREYPTLLAGGLQDNGAAITFGNRTWYRPRWCDGYDVGSDPANPDTFYADCGGLREFANPIPGTPGGLTQIQWAAPRPHAPLITDDVVAHAALATGGDACGEQTIAKTLNGVDWEDTNVKFPPGVKPVALASSPSAGFKSWMAAIAYDPPTKKQCPDFVGAAFSPQVIRTDNAGGQWDQVMGLPFYLVPSSVAFDPKEPSRGYVTYRSDWTPIYMTVGLQSWNISGSGDSALQAGVRSVAVDPFDTNVLYAATAVGMFRGVVTPGITPTAAWEAFDEGLPDSLEINDLWVDPATGILTIGSFGYSAYRRDISPGAECKPRLIVVRDTVYDDGRQPSGSGIPDAEHPIPDPSRPEGPFYKPDDTFAGAAWWWASRDIRIDVPSKNPPKNTIENADSVEFELCPTSISDCEPQAMIDSAPEASKEARVYVQVTNRGVEAVQKTRVIALWSPASGAYFNLPATFWTKTFPPNGAECGPLDPGAWKLVDPNKPCRTIETVTPDMPELARFNWNVPQAADGGASMLTIIESQDDPLEESIRAQNKLALSTIVPDSRHIALRGVRVLDLSVRVPFLWPLDLLHLPEEMSEVEVVLSKPDLREGVRIVLPAGLTARAGFGSVRQTRVTEAELVRKLETMRLDPNNAWEFSGDEASLFVDLKPGERVTTAVIATPASTEATSRVSIVERSRGKVIGGSVMLLRPKATRSSDQASSTNPAAASPSTPGSHRE